MTLLDKEPVKRVEKNLQLELFPKNAPEVSGSARGASPTYPGPCLTHFDKTSSDLAYKKLL